MPTSRPIALLRDVVFRSLNAIPATREYFTEARLKPQPRYKKGFLLFDGTQESKKWVGVMLPQPEVRTAQGKKMLLDDVLGTGFALLRLSDKHEAAFASLRSDTWQRTGVRFVSIENEISDFMLNRRDLFILVRPDRYVCGVFREEHADAFAAAFQKKLASNDSELTAVRR